MNRPLTFFLALAAAACLAAAVAPSLSATAKPAKPAKSPMQELPAAPEKIDPAALPAADWQAKLTPEQYRILRKAGTERPNGEVYHQFKQQGAGTYFCAGCGAELFSSEHKFDSRCGWPSFWDPARIEAVELRTDSSLGTVRTEVVCRACKGHLGHVFAGEGFDTPTDQRYCINGTVLVFVPAQQP